MINTWPCASRATFGRSRVFRKRHTVLVDFIRPEKFFLRSFSPVVVNRWRVGSDRPTPLQPERKGIQFFFLEAPGLRGDCLGERAAGGPLTKSRRSPEKFN
jgi:hypothetical protein